MRSGSRSSRDDTRASLLASRARHMRFAPTPSEERLWTLLSSGKLGVSFKRQVPLGRFIVDFLAPSVRLVVEVDGGYHLRRAAADERRDVALQRGGYHVLRIDAEIVMRQPELAVARVLACVARLRG